MHRCSIENVHRLSHADVRSAGEQSIEHATPTAAEHNKEAKSEGQLLPALAESNRDIRPGQAAGALKEVATHFIENFAS